MPARTCARLAVGEQLVRRTSPTPLKALAWRDMLRASARSAAACAAPAGAPTRVSRSQPDQIVSDECSLCVAPFGASHFGCCTCTITHACGGVQPPRAPSPCLLSPNRSTFSNGCPPKGERTRRARRWCVCCVLRLSSLVCGVHDSECVEASPPGAQKRVQSAEVRQLTLSGPALFCVPCIAVLQVCLFGSFEY